MGSEEEQQAKMAEAFSYRTLGSTTENPYILALDVGTTTVRCHVYDKQAQIKGSGIRKVELIRPQPGTVEMDQDLLWRQVQETIKDAIQSSGVTANEITCMGITTLRNTFIMWDKETGRPFHNINVWQDLRASEMVKQWNKSFTLRSFNGVCKLLYLLTRSNRFLGGSVLKFKSAVITIRLLWMIQNNPQLAKRIKENQVCLGNVDTYLLWKLTGEKVFATDYSNASSTGLYDTYQTEWSKIVSALVGTPTNVLPPVKDTSGLFGYCEPNLFGAAIPITAMVADQQGAMFGQCCFEVGDVKCSMGTGTFVDINTGPNPHASMAGFYPLIGWKIGNEITYLAEGFSADTGRCMEWLQSLGFCNHVSETSDIANSVDSSDGAYFIPSFSGLQPPINNDRACTCLIGLKQKTTKAHIVRAVLESLAFRCKLIYDEMLKETCDLPTNFFRVDGGVSNNNFLMQMVSDLIRLKVDRPKHTDIAALGAAFLAGLAAGVWKSKEELSALRTYDICFEPQKSVDAYKEELSEWSRAVKRSFDWYRYVDI